MKKSTISSTLSLPWPTEGMALDVAGYSLEGIFFIFLILAFILTIYHVNVTNFGPIANIFIISILLSSIYYGFIRLKKKGKLRYGKKDIYDLLRKELLNNLSTFIIGFIPLIIAYFLFQIYSSTISRVEGGIIYSYNPILMVILAFPTAFFSLWGISCIIIPTIRSQIAIFFILDIFITGMIQLVRRDSPPNSGPSIEKREERTESKSAAIVGAEEKPTIHFLRKESQGSYVYFFYKGTNKDMAIDFLQQIKVPKSTHYIVETPSGNFGKDINGIYEK